MRWARGGDASRIPHPASRHAQTLEHFTVEVFLALKQFIEPSQEKSRLRSVDDPVIVGRGDRHDLGAPDGPDRAGRDDRALALREALYVYSRADGPRAGQAEREHRELGREQLASE